VEDRNVETIDAEALRMSEYFVDLTQGEWEWLRRNCHMLHKPAGAVVISEGAESPGLLVVAAGSVKVCRLSPDGREQILRGVQKGGSFNDVPVFDGGTCPATVIAIEDSHILAVPAPVFRELLCRHSTVAVQLLQTYAARLRSVTRLAGDLSLLDVVSRVAKSLDLYTEASGTEEFTLRQSDLASIVGSRREVVARALKRLETDGAIARQGDRILVSDRARLVGAHNCGT
jgi:CRP/FNR family transcriptional regulator